MVSRDREVGEEQGAEMGKVRSKGGAWRAVWGLAFGKEPQNPGRDLRVTWQRHLVSPQW